MSWAPFVTAIPEMVSIASPVGTPPAQIGPSAVALPFSRVTPYVPDPSSKTPPRVVCGRDRIHDEDVVRVVDEDAAAVVVCEFIAAVPGGEGARLTDR